MLCRAVLLVTPRKPLSIVALPGIVGMADFNLLGAGTGLILYITILLVCCLALLSLYGGRGGEIGEIVMSYFAFYCKFSNIR